MFHIDSRAALNDRDLDRGGGGVVLPYMTYTGCAAGQGKVFVLSVLIRVYNFVQVCPEQGI